MHREAWLRAYGHYYSTNGYSKPPWEIYDQFLKVVDGALAMAWVTSDPRLTSALVGPRTLDQFGVAVESLRLTLSTEERDAIAGRMQRAGGHPVQQGTGT